MLDVGLVVIRRQMFVANDTIPHHLWSDYAGIFLMYVMCIQRCNHSWLVLAIVALFPEMEFTK